MQRYQARNIVSVITIVSHCKKACFLSFLTLAPKTIAEAGVDFLNGKAAPTLEGSDDRDETDRLKFRATHRHHVKHLSSATSPFTRQDIDASHSASSSVSPSTDPGWQASSRHDAGGTVEDRSRSLLAQLRAAREKYAAQQAALARLEERVRAAAQSDAADATAAASASAADSSDASEAPAAGGTLDQRRAAVMENPAPPIAPRLTPALPASRRRQPDSSFVAPAVQRQGGAASSPAAVTAVAAVAADELAGVRAVERAVQQVTALVGTLQVR